MSASSAISNILSQPSLIYYYGQKSIRSIPIRQAAGGLVARLLGHKSAYDKLSPSSEIVATELIEDGISFLPQLTIGSTELQAISSFLKDKPVIDWYDNTALFMNEPIPKPHTRLGYRTTDLVRCRPLLDLANSPLILDAVERVLGARPTIAWFQSWWTIGENYDPGVRHYDDIYHRDVDDFRFVKLFAYLTDTNIENGAHSFVKGSHRDSRFTARGPITDEQVHAAFRKDDVIAVTGKAGTVFLENTWGIHRPLLPTAGRRQIFSALYTLTPFVPRSVHDKPVDRMPMGIDPYVNRALFL